MNKTLIFDMDGTICNRNSGVSYKQAVPNKEMIIKINELYEQDFKILIHTSRGVDKEISTLNENVMEPTEKWLKTNNVLYHEIIFRKPYAKNGYYIDNNSLTVDAFLKMNFKI